jgi:hypothetical protein
MRVFLLDLWMDLREKRLAPIAIALLAGIVAVPIVLAKGSTPPPPPPAATTVASAAPVVVRSAPAKGAVDSKLQTFSPRDPFEPTRVAAVTTGGTTPKTGTGTTKTTTGTTTAPSGGGTTTTPSGGGTTTTPSGGTTQPTKAIVFTYTVDLRFGPPGTQKLFKGVQRLELIPSQADPKIVFLGITTSGKTAAFLVDSKLGVDTNGKCSPSPDQCTFLYLRPDGAHDQAVLTDQSGNTWRLHLLGIHRVAIAAVNGKSGSGKRSPAFTGKADSTGTSTGTTTTTTTGDSTGQPAAASPQPHPAFQARTFFSDEVK